MSLLRTGIAYSLVGGAGFLAYLLLFAGLVELSGYPPVVAAAVAFVPVLLATYYLNHLVIFHSRRTHREALLRYVAVAGFGFVINVGTIYIGSELLGWWYGYAQLLSCVLVPVSNFLLSRAWVFGDGLDSN